jgi:hypothetical protein
LYRYVGGDPGSNADPLGLSEIVVDRSNSTMYVMDKHGNPVSGPIPATNNASSTSKGPWPQGSFAFEKHNEHPERGPDSDTGSDFFGFDVSRHGRKDMGVHAGRQGVCDKAGRCDHYHATRGCFRTTPKAIDVIRELHRSDPLRSITVVCPAK